MPTPIYERLCQGAPLCLRKLIDRAGTIHVGNSPYNEVHGTILALSVLSSYSAGNAMTFFCHPSVQHIHKEPDEGGWCGYRNISMMFSYLQGIGMSAHPTRAHTNSL